MKMIISKEEVYGNSTFTSNVKFEIGGFATAEKIASSILERKDIEIRILIPLEADEPTMSAEAETDDEM